MIGFLLHRAVANLKATWAITLLSVLAVALGTSVPTAVYALRALHDQDPIPEKSDVLFNVRVDSWTSNGEFFDIEPGEPPKHITYRDMRGLLDAPQPLRRTAVSSASAFVFPARDELAPYPATFQLCHADLFAMFNAPFRFGGGWSRSDDQARRRVVVLSQAANEKLFGGVNSVGQQVRLGAGTFEVIGVLAAWNPTPYYFDVINNAMGRVREFFVPFDLMRNAELDWQLAADSDSWGESDSRDPNAFFDASETTWIQYWVELASEQVDPYRDFVDAYTAQQRVMGRFPRPQNNRITPLMEWLALRKVVPAGSLALLIVGLMFMALCSLNLSSLLLGKYLGESQRMGVQRALGASRAVIFWQRLIECEMVGVMGAILGAILATLFLRLLIGNEFDSGTIEALTQFDSAVFLPALGFSLLSGLVAGLYPAWQVARTPPALQLKARS